LNMAGYLEQLAACLRLDATGVFPKGYKPGERRTRATERYVLLAWYLDTGGAEDACNPLPPGRPGGRGVAHFLAWEPGEIKKLIGASAWRTYEADDWKVAVQPGGPLARIGGAGQALAVATAGDSACIRDALQRSDKAWERFRQEHGAK